MRYISPAAAATGIVTPIIVSRYIARSGRLAKSMPLCRMTQYDGASSADMTGG
jgi:hypothetical protein